MLTLKEVNELNKKNLTLEQVRIIHNKHRYAPVIYAGNIVEFIPENFEYSSKANLCVNKK
jgi:hypothetical protein